MKYPKFRIVLVKQPYISKVCYVVQSKISLFSSWFDTGHQYYLTYRDAEKFMNEEIERLKI